jgi:DNA-binding transcriptional ArsR family regulator
MELLQRPDQVRLALSPTRRRILEQLREPSSATGLASTLAMSRQLVNYHLRALERAGLVELVEERQRRGCVERVLRARAQAFVVDPAVMGEGGTVTAAQDRYAAEHLVNAATSIVREVTRMGSKAEREGTRLLTFTLETDIRFAEPRDVERFTTTLAELIAQAASKYHVPTGGRAYRVIVGGHPSPATQQEDTDDRP